MKKLLLLMCAVLFTLNALPQNSIFTVFSEEGEKFTLYVDGEQINSSPQSRVADVKNANEAVAFRIEFSNPKIPAIKKNAIMLRGVDGEFQKLVFVIKQNNKGQYNLKVSNFETYNPQDSNTEKTVSTNETVIQEKPENTVNVQVTEPTTIKVTSQVKNDGNNVVVTNEKSTLDVTMPVNMSVSVNANNNANSNENVSVDFKVSGSNTTSSGENVNLTMNVSGMSTTSSTTSSYTESTSGNVEKKSEKRCEYATTDSEFSKIKASIESKDFEDSKLTVAKDVAKSKCLTSAQIREIMGMFTYEENRLEFAAFAYKFVYDKDNYYEVYNAFQFELTIDDLKKKLGI